MDCFKNFYNCRKHLNCSSKCYDAHSILYVNVSLLIYWFSQRVGTGKERSRSSQGIISDQRPGSGMNKNLILYQTIPSFNNPPEKSLFENNVGKGENAGNQDFLLFTQFFLCFKGHITLLALNFVSFFSFVNNNTIMSQYLRQEVKWKRTLFEN